ncbi:MAG: dTMP kinase [Bdellovibrio sp.]|nr:MAG: dTMP kinase [Bdellovibrio sp.]
MPFIVFEGLDGTGKSSLMSALEGELSQRQRPTLRTREPGGTSLGDEIRQLILRTGGEAPAPRTELLLYEASRAQHVDSVIAPALKKKIWVLCDRYTASSIAFQAGGRGIPVDRVEALNDFATNGLTPDLTVLLDLTVGESRRRRQSRQGVQGTSADRIESETDTFHEKVRQSFLQQAEKSWGNWLVLDASNSPAVLLQDLLDELRRRQWLDT